MKKPGPATKGILAEPPSHADPIPAIEMLNKNAKGATIQGTPTRVAMCLTACTIPCNTLILSLLTAISSVSVAPIYRRPERIPPHATAPGKVFSGFSISSPITEASSSPTKPKQITPNELSTNRGFAGIAKSAEVTAVPNRSQTTIPSPINTTAALPVPIAPKLLIHFPTPSPTIFITTKIISSSNEAVSAKLLLSASDSCPAPSAYTETPTKYSITVGTYIMLLVQ